MARVQNLYKPEATVKRKDFADSEKEVLDYYWNVNIMRSERVSIIKLIPQARDLQGRLSKIKEKYF